MKFKGASIRDPKQRGEWAEIRFMARATEEGLQVTKPWGDSARYDFAVECNGRFLRVQVKSTIQSTPDGYRCWVQPARASGPYTPEQVDFFACYLIPEDVWYILPAGAVTRIRGQVRLSPHGKGHKYEQYWEAWRLLRQKLNGEKNATRDAAESGVSGTDSPSVEPPATTEIPGAEPGEVAQIRAVVEAPPPVGFDPDLLRRRMVACFEWMKRNSHDR